MHLPPHSGTRPYASLQVGSLSIKSRLNQLKKAMALSKASSRVRASPWLRYLAAVVACCACFFVETEGTLTTLPALVALQPRLVTHSGRRLADEISLRKRIKVSEDQDPSEEEYAEFLKQRLAELEDLPTCLVTSMPSSNGRVKLSVTPKNSAAGEAFTAHLTTRQAFDFLLKGELEMIKDYKTVADGLKMTEVLAAAQNSLPNDFTYSMHRSRHGLRFHSKISREKFSRSIFIFPELQELILKDPEVLWKQLHLKKLPDGSFDLDISASKEHPTDGLAPDLTRRHHQAPQNFKLDNAALDQTFCVNRIGNLVSIYDKNMCFHWKSLTVDEGDKQIMQKVETAVKGLQTRQKGLDRFLRKFGNPGDWLNYQGFEVHAGDGSASPYLEFTHHDWRIADPARYDNHHCNLDKAAINQLVAEKEAEKDKPFELVKDILPARLTTKHIPVPDFAKKTYHVMHPTRPNQFAEIDPKTFKTDLLGCSYLEGARIVMDRHDGYRDGFKIDKTDRMKKLYKRPQFDIREDGLIAHYDRDYVLNLQNWFRFLLEFDPAVVDTERAMQMEEWLTKTNSKEGGMDLEFVKGTNLHHDSISETPFGFVNNNAETPFGRSVVVSSFSNAIEQSAMNPERVVDTNQLKLATTPFPTNLPEDKFPQSNGQRICKYQYYGISDVIVFTVGRPGPDGSMLDPKECVIPKWQLEEHMKDEDFDVNEILEEVADQMMKDEITHEPVKTLPKGGKNLVWLDLTGTGALAFGSLRHGSKAMSLKGAEKWGCYKLTKLATYLEEHRIPAEQPKNKSNNNRQTPETYVNVGMPKEEFHIAKVWDEIYPVSGSLCHIFFILKAMR
eukprot:GHVT01051081.1.p1 GENE.GHVT01051081.1~~GHVT01051081.1.p1  ORF type:complete len:841 (+),score=115.54 GHVT01051081.1:270-2792(+)